MDHMYAAMPPKHLNATEKPSGSSPVAVCMRDHNFSRPPADLPDNGKELNVQYSPKSSRVNSPTTRERNLPGQNSRRKSDLFATSACTTTSRSSTAEADEDEIDNEEDSDERDDNFIPVATVASAPNSPARMRSLLAEYLLSATAAHPQHEVPCTDKEMGAEDNTDSSAQGQQQLDTSCAVSVDDTLLDEAEDCDRLVDETEKDKNQSTLSQQQSKNAVHRNTEKGGGPTLIDTGIETVGKAVTNVDKGAPATEKIITNADGNFHRWSAISSVDDKITNVEDDVEQCSDVPQQEKTSEMDTSVSETNTHVLESDSFKSTLNVPKVSTTTTSDDDSDISHDALQVGGVSNSTCSNSTTNAASCSQSCSISSIKSEIITSDEESAINTRTGSHRVQSSAKGSTRSHNVIVKLETEEKSDTLPTSQGYSTIVTPCVSEQPKAVATLKRKALTGKHSPKKTYISVKTGPFGLEYKSVSESKLERQPGKLQTSTHPSAPVITRKPCRKRTSGQAGLDASGDAQSITAVRVSCGSMSASPSDSFSTTADGSSIKIVDAAASTPTKLKKLSLSGNTPLSKKVFFPQAESSLDTSLFLVPLKKHGWKRELVLRGVFGEDVNKKNPPADTYYFTPDGKKLALNNRAPQRPLLCMRHSR